MIKSVRTAKMELLLLMSERCFNILKDDTVRRDCIARTAAAIEGLDWVLTAPPDVSGAAIAAIGSICDDLYDMADNIFRSHGWKDRVLVDRIDGIISALRVACGIGFDA